MKWLGILLILVAFCLGGINGMHRLQQRADDLYELCRALEVLEGEISWRQAGLAAIAAAHTDIPFFSRWAKALQNNTAVFTACMQAIQPMCLSPADRRLLQEFAVHAGRLDRVGQLAQLKRIRTQLEQRAVEAHEEAKNKGRVQLTLALCLGGVVSLLLL